MSITLASHVFKLIIFWTC